MENYSVYSGYVVYVVVHTGFGLEVKNGLTNLDSPAD